MTLYLKYAARSDRGLVRTNNQDSVFAGPRLLAVADGMGGHVGGEVASNIVIAAIEYLDADDPGGDMLAALREATESSSEQVREMVDEHPELDGMGTTLTALLFNGRRVGLCHVGDSRAYLLRDDDLTQITHDDTFVQALIDEGRITEEEASVHPQRSVILRAINGMDVDPALSMREGRAGDRYLLCSDGLSSFVSHERIEKVLRGTEDVSAAADELIEFALRAGGPDNVTVIVADLLGDDDGIRSDGVPVVDGAAGPKHTARQRKNTPAARAAAITQPDEDDSAEDDSTEDAPTRTSLRRRLSVLLVAMLLVIGLTAAGWAYVNSQYFVGVSGDKVVIYNGVNSTIGPVELYSEEESTDYLITDLEPATQQRITNGVSASSLEAARAVVDRLKQNLLPYCPEDSATTSPAPTETAPTDPTASASSAPADATVSPQPTQTTQPGPADPTGTDRPTSTPAPQPTIPEPGVDCRIRR